MRKPTIAELQNRIDSLTPYETALQLALTTTPITETFRHDGATYTYSLYGATRATGGVLVVKISAKGHSTTVDAHWFDSLLSRVREMGSATEYTSLLNSVMSRLESARNRALDIRYAA